MFYNKGKLIVIEGADGSGKATQARLLSRALEEYGPVASYEFPRYKQSEFGRLIGRSLTGEFGDFLNLSPYLSSLPYMLDRARAKYLLIESLKEGNVVCDRYTPSNIAFQSAKLKPAERKEFITFLERAEYEELGLPAPDLVVYLSVPTSITSELLLKKEKRAYIGVGEKDQYEKNVEYQQEAMNIYRDLSKKRSN